MSEEAVKEYLSRNLEDRGFSEEVAIINELQAKIDEMKNAIVKQADRLHNARASNCLA